MRMQQYSQTSSIAVPQKEIPPIADCLPKKMDMVSGQLTMCQFAEERKQSRLPEKVHKTSIAFSPAWCGTQIAFLSD
jgi:hypothetical protein